MQLVSEVEPRRWRDRLLAAAVCAALFLLVVGIVYLTYLRFATLYKLGFHGYLHIIGEWLGDLLRVIAFLAGVVCVFGGVVLVQALASQWRRVRVFISFKAENETLAAEIKAAIDNRWLEAQYLPFEERDHDAVIQWVRQGLARCDALVVLPGSQQSFVDNEILAASAQSKAIVFIKTDPNQTTPNSALRGYPVFDLVQLRSREFHPLARFLRYVCSLWRDTLLNFARASAGTLSVLLQFLFGYFVLFSVPLRIVSDVLQAINLQWTRYFVRDIEWVGAAGAALVLSYKYFRATWERMRAIKVARQSILTGACTFELLEAGLSELEGDQEILDCLEREPLPVRHGQETLAPGQTR